MILAACVVFLYAALTYWQSHTPPGSTAHRTLGRLREACLIVGAVAVIVAYLLGPES